MKGMGGLWDQHSRDQQFYKWGPTRYVNYIIIIKIYIFIILCIYNFKTASAMLITSA